jgi:hypothetical protein
MKYIGSLILAFLFSSFAYAGAQHNWCEVVGLEAARYCEDQTKQIIKIADAEPQVFRFLRYEDNRSTVIMVTADGQFTLIQKEFGLIKRIQDERDGAQYELECGLTEHGLCPN